MSVYYNENDPQAAAWLRELIKNGLIPDGDVDERSIEDVRPIDIDHYNQCHFFAGIGGWAYALDLAGWPRDRPVWTGSCPCQPFSAAGKGAGFADERHLWPAWQHLIAQCRPSVVFGEQVAAKAADEWIDLVHSDMEGMGYAFGCVPFPAAGVGAPHIRDRNYWVADTSGERLEERERVGRVQRQALGAFTGQAAFGGGDAGRVVNAQGEQMGVPGCAWLGREADWIDCRDGKRRPVESGTFPLANGLPERVVRVRGYGNAIVAPQAAEFIRAYLESRASVAVAA